MVDASKIVATEDLLRLWYHENLRVFQDRLINDEDRGWFSGLLDEKVTQVFGCEKEKVIQQMPVLYGDFMQPNSDVKLYAEITDHNNVSITSLSKRNFKRSAINVEPT